MSTVKSKKLQVGTDATSSNNFTIYQPATPDGTLRIGVGNADSPTEVGQFNANGYKAAANPIVKTRISSAHNLSNAIFTKLQFNTIMYDNTSTFDTTNYRWIPQIAGYYLINTNLHFQGLKAAASQVYCVISKNAANEAFGSIIETSQDSSLSTPCTAIVYMNGTTDYLELYAWHNSGVTITMNADKNLTYFSGYLIQQG